MKVLLVNLVRQGGMVHYHSQLANALAQHLSVAVLIASAANQQYYTNLPEVIKIPTGQSARNGLLALANPVSWINIYRTCRRPDIDLIHITSPYIWNIFFIWLVKKPIVYTVHDPQPHTGEKKWVAWIERRMRTKARLLIVHGQQAKQQLIDQGYPPHIIKVSKHGDYSFFQKQSPESKVQSPESKIPQLLFFGRIEPYKGLDILLDAMSQVWQEHPQCQLVIAGQGDLPQHHVLSDNRVVVKNYFIADSQVADLFQSAEIVVLPYRDASQSGVIPIASAFSRPTIVSDVGSLSEAVDHQKTGLLVAPESVEELAKAIISLLDDPGRQQAMGQAAHQKMIEELDWHKIVLGYQDMYQQALAPPLTHA